MTLLSLSKVEKHYPGVKALDGVDFQLREGEVHALLGENGAGKSTLVKVMTGALEGDGGSMTYLDKPLKLKSTAHAQTVGISTVYQEVNLLPNLTVAQNLYLGREPKKFGLIDWKRINRQSKEVLKRFDLDIDVTRPLSSFSVAIQQLIAIARGVDMSAKVLVLDEPTASLDADECEQLFGVMRELKAKGIGIVFITHFLDQVYAVCDRITVLRNGQLVGEFEAATLPRSALVGHMLGKELQAETKAQADGPRQQSALAEPLLDLKQVAVRGSLHPTDLTVRRGEAVGLAGLLGAGRSEVCRAVFGVDKKTSGTLTFKNSEQHFRQPSEAIAEGLALCPEDRKTSGIVGPLSIRENIALAVQARRGWWRPISRAEQQALADKFIAELQIATPDAEKPIEQLSGGNQQKVILARWLATNPQLLVLDEPTRGVDIGAHAEILKLIKKLCSEGMSLLVTSSELDELVAFSDRVAVMRDRRKVAEIEGDDITEGNIMQAIAEA
ncbi:sugar ABC transporter ATP-binding protein [Microbulbifer hydrolyticus]|uniref:ATP-binding cassette domain-containing protein n=1 Tax=Microbulbifer hydrolyticus TaxID=48074 RepID=A0A6P1T5W9_9GAMM|nr:sugar ABC transporter ATP-binding protein [Microbulbifer hydrolyticus]MBB5211071.1 simple sugar transport system ATP-binding protein [Microbulbifer hydrolyticus]QHQ38138.1 ATP-binding cassette domain-containing protein [Microbulbifer hydrolyticus]